MSKENCPEYEMTAAWLELRRYRVMMASSLGLTYLAAQELGWDEVMRRVFDRATRPD